MTVIVPVFCIELRSDVANILSSYEWRGSNETRIEIKIFEPALYLIH